MVNTAVLLLPSIFKENASHLFVINKVNLYIFWYGERGGVLNKSSILQEFYTFIGTAVVYTYLNYTPHFKNLISVSGSTQPDTYNRTQQQWRQALEWFNWGQCPDGWTKNDSGQWGNGHFIGDGYCLLPVPCLQCCLSKWTKKDILLFGGICSQLGNSDYTCTSSCAKSGKCIKYLLDCQHSAGERLKLSQCGLTKDHESHIKLNLHNLRLQFIDNLNKKIVLEIVLLKMQTCWWKCVV